MKPIAKILAFYMFIGSLIPNSDFSRLIHIPDMIAHYQLHVEEAEDKGISFTWFDFFNYHLINPNSHQHDGHNNHENCPFHPLHATNSFFLSTNDFSFSTLVVSFFSESLAYKNAFYLKGFVSVETQPPTMA